MAANDQQLQALIGINNELQRSSDYTKKLIQGNTTLGTALDKVFRATSRYATSVEDITKLESKGIKTLNERKKLQNELKDLAEDISLLDRKRVESITLLSQKEKSLLDSAQRFLSNRENLIKKQNRLSEIAKDLTKDSKDREEIEGRIKSISNSIAFQQERLNDLSKENSNVLFPLALSVQLNSLKAIQRQTGVIKTQGSWWDKILGKSKKFYQDVLGGNKALLAGAAAVTGITLTVGGLFKAMKDGFFEIDNSVTNITKSSGLSKDISEQLLKNYRGIQDGTVAISGNLNFALATTKNLLAAQQELQSSTELSALFTQGSVESQVYLTKQLGMSAEEATKLNSLSLVGKQTTEDTVKAAYDQVEALAKSNGVRLQGRAVLREVAKIEGVIAANYNNNPKKLIEAVALTKSLGTNLQVASSASRSLLDFESSIENELEAELLTGRRFNLEKARSLALDGDSAAAVKEMLKNVGSLQDFQRQNVLAKEAEAKAVGMTVDQLADALRQQELIKSLSIEDRNARDEILERVKGTADFDKYRAQLNAATSAEELRAAEQSIGKQEKFNSLIDKLKDKVVEMGDPLLKFVTSFENVIENAQRFSGLLKGIAITMTAIAVASTIASFGASLVAAGATIAGSTIATAAGIGAGAAGISAYAVLNDGVVDPNGGIVLSTPKGQIKTNKDDYIVATTDPASLLGGGGGSGKTDQLLSAILSAVSKPSGVYIDSYRAGTALGMSNSAFA